MRCWSGCEELDLDTAFPVRRMERVLKRDGFRQRTNTTVVDVKLFLLWVVFL